MMNAEQLLDHLQHPNAVTPAELAAFRDLTVQYPYFQAAYALIAKAAYDKDHPNVGLEVQTAAIFATDRNHLRALLEGEPPFETPPQATPDEVPPIEAPVAAPAPDPKTATIVEVPNQFINGYISHLRQKAAHQITKKKSLEQLNIIQTFIQRNVSFKPQSLQALPDPSTQADLTQESSVLHDNLLTETLAQVLFRQGKVQRAVDVYTKLSLKFPEKKTYFAALAEELKTQI